MKKFFRLLASAFLFLVPVIAHSSSNHYQVSSLVSNIGGAAPYFDGNLVNPWGLIFDQKGHLIVADNNSNLATSYEQDGMPRNFYIILPINPTGVETNYFKDDFKIGSGENRRHAKLLFCTEAGTVLAFNESIDPHHATVVIDNSSSHAVYKGIALAQVHDSQHLYLADFHNGKIDVFNHKFQYINSFTDSTAPAGFAPFNIRNIQGKLYVTYALQLGPANIDDQPGPGNGFVDIFDLDGTLVKRLVSGGALNSPWGITLATDCFGKFQNALLVGNFGDGKINAYDCKSGAFLGHLHDAQGNTIVIDGLWSLKFKSDSWGSNDNPNDALRENLYFTSGPNGETNGLVGVITPIASSSHHHKHHH